MQIARLIFLIIAFLGVDIFDEKTEKKNFSSEGFSFCSYDNEKITNAVHLLLSELAPYELAEETHEREEEETGPDKDPQPGLSVLFYQLNGSFKASSFLLMRKPLTFFRPCASFYLLYRRLRN